MNRPQPQPREAYAHFSTITTRWMDNDVYGHVNNVTYYSYFDTAVNRYLIEAGVLDIHAGEVIGLVIETQCNYFAPLVFPQTVEAGIRVARLGGSSVRYEVGLFAQGEPMTAAKGHFIHVYVDSATRRPASVETSSSCPTTAMRRPPPALLQTNVSVGSPWEASARHTAVRPCITSVAAVVAWAAVATRDPSSVSTSTPLVKVDPTSTHVTKGMSAA